MAPKRDLSFYAEIVILTVLAIVGANIWTEWLNRWVERKYGKTETSSLILAIGITVGAVLLLWGIFGKKHTSSYDEQYEDEKGQIKATPFLGNPLKMDM